MNNDYHIVLPTADIYYIGDPCHLLPEEAYDDMIANSDRIEEAGYHSKGHTFSVGPNIAAIFYTDGGDGTYRDQVGRKFVVDSGQIAVVPMELVWEDHPNADHDVTLYQPRPTDLVCHYHGGTGIIDIGQGAVVINTRVSG